jgi:hypothetical protein
MQSGLEVIVEVNKNVHMTLVKCAPKNSFGQKTDFLRLGQFVK